MQQTPTLRLLWPDAWAPTAFSGLPILVDDQVVPTSDPAIVQVPGMNILDRAVRLGVMPDDLIRPVPVGKTAMKP